MVGEKNPSRKFDLLSGQPWPLYQNPYRNKRINEVFFRNTIGRVFIYAFDQETSNSWQCSIVFKMCGICSNRRITKEDDYIIIYFYRS